MASMRPGGGKPQNANQGRGFCGILLSIIKWVTIIVGMILLLMYFGVFTRLGAYSWIDSYKDSDGNERFKGIAPWVHHGKPWGFKLKELKDGSLADRVIIVTGANVGLGFSSAVALAGKGAEVVMACRSPEKCAKAAEDARERIQTMKGHGHVHPMILDLASFESIRLFVENFHSKYSSLHSLMLNAGIMMTPFGLTADGIEQQIGVNHFGHFYLTKLLLPLLRQTGTKALPATIVSVSSSAHFRTYPHGLSLSLSELNNEENYNTMQAYGQSKLSNVLFAQELAERERELNSNVLVNSIHPGAVDTELSRYMLESLGDNVGGMLKGMASNLLWDSDTASLTQIYTSVGPSLLKEKISGQYFHPIARQTKPHSVFGFDTKLQKGLWVLSEEVVAAFEEKNKKE